MSFYSFPLTISKKIYSFLFFLIINLIFLEFFSLFILLFLGKAHWNYESALQDIPKNIFWGKPQPGRLTHIHERLFSGSVPHPYFAFRYNGSSYNKTSYGVPVDVHGFMGDVKFPFKKKSTEFIFGILGGSVSRHLAGYIFKHEEARERLINVLRERYPEATDKNIKLVSLGQHGNKQPQQFFIAGYLLKYLDLTINVDGYNEYNEPVPIEYPIEFPSEWHFYYLNGVDRENHNLHQKAQNIWFLRQVLDMARLDRYVPFLKFSQSYFLFQQFFHAFAAKKILKNLREIRTIRDRNRNKPTYFSPLYENKKTSLKVEVWKRFSLQQFHLSKAYGVESLFFLQPIPAIPDAKIWSKEEKEKEYYKEDPKKRKFCKLIRKEIQSLQEKKLPFYDLSYIFKNVKETLYVDEIHLNDQGLAILFEEILKVIKTKN